MRFSIELEDFWLEDGDIEQALKDHVTTSVMVQIKESIQKKIDKEITEKLNVVIEEKLSVIIDAKMSDLIDEGMIRSNREEIPLTEHIKRMFVNNHGWSSADRKIEQIAKKFGEELKLQYNAAFANKIVQNMKTQGLLKDDVVQILLGGNDG